MNLKNRCLEYFNHFSNKDIDKVMRMCDGPVELKDWDIDVKGFGEVQRSIVNIFDNVDTIKIIPLSLYQDELQLIEKTVRGYVVCCQIEILVNGEEKLDVMDVITFNEDGFIKSIKAYKC